MLSNDAFSSNLTSVFFWLPTMIIIICRVPSVCSLFIQSPGALINFNFSFGNLIFLAPFDLCRLQTKVSTSIILKAAQCSMMTPNTEKKLPNKKKKPTPQLRKYYWTVEEIQENKQIKNSMFGIYFQFSISIHLIRSAVKWNKTSLTFGQ